MQPTFLIRMNVANMIYFLIISSGWKKKRERLLGKKSEHESQRKRGKGKRKDCFSRKMNDGIHAIIYYLIAWMCTMCRMQYARCVYWGWQCTKRLAIKSDTKTLSHIIIVRFNRFSIAISYNEHWACYMHTSSEINGNAFIKSFFSLVSLLHWLEEPLLEIPHVWFSVFVSTCFSFFLHL